MFEHYNIALQDIQSRSKRNDALLELRNHDAIDQKELTRPRSN